MLPEAIALAPLVNRGSFHGIDLIKAMGIADNVARAEKALRSLQKIDWIERGNYDPSKEQLFFGIGGFPGNKLRGLVEQYRSPVAHHWITKTYKYLAPEDVDKALMSELVPCKHSWRNVAAKPEQNVVVLMRDDDIALHVVSLDIAYRDHQGWRVKIRCTVGQAIARWRRRLNIK